MAKIDTLFLTKTAKKPYPLGPTYPYSPYKGVTPPPVLDLTRSITFGYFQFRYLRSSSFAQCVVEINYFSEKLSS